MTAGEQAVTDALVLEDLARVARRLRAIGVARPPRRRPRPIPEPAGVEAHDGHVWWAAGPDAEAVALALAARAARPDRPATPEAPAGPSLPPGLAWPAGGGAGVGARPDACRPYAGSPQRPFPSPTAHGPVRLAVVDPDERKLRLARMVVATGEPWRGGDDVWFVPGGLAGDQHVAGAGAGSAGAVALFVPGPAHASPGVAAGPAAYELLALARWLGVEATGPRLVEAALRRLGAAPAPATTPAEPGAGLLDLPATSSAGPGGGSLDPPAVSPAGLGGGTVDPPAVSPAGPSGGPLDPPAVSSAGLGGGTVGRPTTDADAVGDEVRRLFDGGARVFVDVGHPAGPHGDLARTVARALDGRDHVTVTALAPGARPLARLDRALAALWAEGVPVLPDALHRPPPAPAGPTPTYQGDS